VAARAELADEKAQYELTKQLLSNLFSSPDLGIQELQSQVQSFEIKLAVVTNQLAIADKNQLRSNLHLALTQQLLSDSQKIAKDVEEEADQYLCERCTKVLCVEALNILHDTIAQHSPVLDPTSPDFLTTVQQFAAEVQHRCQPNFCYVRDLCDNYHTANTEYAKDLR
jgi:hypothetical protein